MNKNFDFLKKGLKKVSQIKSSPLLIGVAIVVLVVVGGYLAFDHFRVLEEVDEETGLTEEEIEELMEHSYYLSLESALATREPVYRLDLRDEGLEELPREIGELTELRELKLNGNRLETLPSEIGNLTNLRKLDLSGNPLDILPSEIRRLENLEVAKLGGLREEEKREKVKDWLSHAELEFDQPVVDTVEADQEGYMYEDMEELQEEEYTQEDIMELIEEEDMISDDLIDQLENSENFNIE